MFSERNDYNNRLHIICISCLVKFAITIFSELFLEYYIFTKLTLIWL